MDTYDLDPIVAVLIANELLAMFTNLLKLLWVFAQETCTVADAFAEEIDTRWASQAARLQKIVDTHYSDLRPILPRALRG